MNAAIPLKFLEEFKSKLNALISMVTNQIFYVVEFFVENFKNVWFKLAKF